MQITKRIREHPRAALAIFVLGLAAFVFGMIWFTPWRLFTDDPVDEALPEAPAETSTGAVAPSETVPVVLAQGEFVGLEHETRGTATVVTTGDGTRFLRFEDFETSNGPDLRVYLSTKPADPDDWKGYDEDFVDLGPLKGNVGDQNYEIPEGVNLEKHATAVVWCRRFTVGFAAADLA